MGIDVFLFASRHLIIVCTQTCIFHCCIVFKAVVCRLYEMLYPCIYNVVISCWKSGAYGFVICRGGTDMCFVLGFGRKRPNLKQYRISGLTKLHSTPGRPSAHTTRQCDFVRRIAKGEALPPPPPPPPQNRGPPQQQNQFPWKDAAYMIFTSESTDKGSRRARAQAVNANMP